jgi:putative DNA primase/helicase
LLEISFGRNRSDTNWKPDYLEWDEFVDKLRKVRRTAETMAEYDRMTNAQKGKVKDGPAYVGGLIKAGRRKKANVESRWLITLDVDHADEDFLFSVDLILGGMSYLIYSTHSHRQASPKYRLVIPTDREMSPDEYAAVGRKVADQIGMDSFDKTTFDVHRLMYMPSCSKDADPVFEESTGEPVKVDVILGEYADWQDVMEWPRHPGEEKQRESRSKKMEDPRSKSGVVGAFCRTYSISEAIETFLEGVYEPTTHEGRYTYAGSSSYGGMVVYDEDTFAYSHHETDPISGREVNAFDLVRLNKFSDLDDGVKEFTPDIKKPSNMAMLEFAANDSVVKRQLLSELTNDFSDSFEDDDDPDAWKDQLDVHPKTGAPFPTAKNVELILRNGSFRDILAYDAFGNTEVIRGPLPWRERVRPLGAYEPWLGADDRRMMHWFGKNYKIKGESTMRNAFTEVTHSNTFHPIKEYIESYSWDGVERIETLFIDYLGAADTHYVRQVSRKMLIAAIKRLYDPGCKFDEMLVFIGPQGAGKSSLLAKLGRKWFSDSLRSFENKEAGEHLQSAWIFEIGELSAMKKSEVEEVKAFLSKTEDRYRVAFDRIVSDFPRKCVFFGTTNTRDFLRDTTGNRRFWPVDIHPELKKYNHWIHLTDDLVGQIWAEALSLYKAGESLELDEEAREEAKRQQASHMETDPREGIIQEWLESPIEDEWGSQSEEAMMHTRVCASQVWVECLHNKKGSMRPWEAKEICDILRRIPGWEEVKGRVRVPNYGQQTAFDRIDKG